MSSPGNDSTANKKTTSAADSRTDSPTVPPTWALCVLTRAGESVLKQVDRQRSYTEKKITVRGGFLGETIRLAIAEAGEKTTRLIGLPPSC
ncbi:MAG: hypothetical protein U0936_20355 [Planctomycetaceae bacterium]